MFTRALIAIAAAALGLSSTPGQQPKTADSAIWHVSRSPKLHVDVAASCPRSVSAYQDVANTFAGPPLVPANPYRGLICRYYGAPHTGSLGRQTRLDAAQAAGLANVVRKLDLKPPVLAMCPMDNGAFALIGLSYHGRADVGLWYATSGCQTLDNGRIGAAEVANPSFYVGFEGAINKLSPSLPR
jgi:hypothetical protein